MSTQTSALENRGFNTIDDILERPVDSTKGVVGIFETSDQLKIAARAVRDRGVRRFDALSPYPVHGIEEAMGLKRSPLPWVTFVGGLTGGSLGLFFQVWTSAYSWPINVGGKPYASWLAFIPVTFECTVLFAGLSTAAALFGLCKIPKALKVVVDPRITNDRFALVVDAGDPKYQETELKEVLKKAGANEVRSL